MHAIVHSADVQDRDGGALLMASLFGAFPFLVKLYADGGYQGPEFQSAMKRILARVNLEIVKRSDQAKGFVALPKRWIVERTLAWLGRCRRLAKDWECLNRKALAFLRLASIRLMLRKLSNPARLSAQCRHPDQIQSTFCSDLDPNLDFGEPEAASCLDTSKNALEILGKRPETSVQQRRIKLLEDSVGSPPKHPF